MRGRLNQKLVFVIDDSSPEPLFSVLKDLIGAPAVDVWPVSNLIQDADVKFVNGRVEFPSQISWPTANNLSFVVDRLVEITSVTVNNAAAKNGSSGLGSCSIGLVSKAYQFVLQNVENWDDKNCQYSTVGMVLPLHLQWNYIRKHFPFVAVPFYLYGYGPEILDYSNFQNPIFKTPFDLYSWRKGIAPENTVTDKFVVERPTGLPVLTFCIGACVFACDPVTGVELQNEKLIQLTNKISSLFCNKINIAEILWFLDGDSVTFGSLSHKLFAATRLEIFHKNVGRIYQELLNISSDWTKR